MTSTLAVIPARAGSKRLKNKNSLPFLGKPLILWTVDFAIKFGGFDLVMVTTDSPEIADLARNAGAYVPWLRPDELASDTATSMDVVLHAVDNVNSRRYNFERVALLQPTSPIRLPERWVQAFEFLDQGAPAAIGVHAAASHPYWTYFMGEQCELSPFFPHGKTNRSQDLPSAFVPNGALYLTGIDSLRTYRTFTPPGTRGVVCTERVESIDIDTAEDWSAAELLSREYFK